MPINNSYNEDAIVEAIATALDNFYTNLIKKVDSLNVKAVMKRKNPYLFRAKAMNGAAQIIDAILAAFVSSSEETIFGNVFFEPIATAAAQGQKALAEGVDIMVERDNTIYAIAVRYQRFQCGQPQEAGTELYGSKQAGTAGKEAICPDCRLWLWEEENLQPRASQVLYGIGGQGFLDGTDR